MRPTVVSRRLLLVLVAVLALTGCRYGPSTSTSTATSYESCPSSVEFRGRTYVGHGDLKRDPATTGRVETATLPGCGDIAAEDVEVAELQDLPMSRALLVLGGVYLREGAPFPEQIRPWFQRPRCTGTGSFEVTGDWLGVRGPKRPRFDGDLRPPYRLDVHLVAPDRLAGGTVWLLVDDATRPALGPDDVTTSLWEGGQVVAVVHCDGRDFVVEGVRSTPG